MEFKLYPPKIYRLHSAAINNTFLSRSLVSIPLIFSPSLSVLQFLSRGISCNRPVQTLIDRECWGFVVALISNTESSALGSSSLHPLPSSRTFRPSSLRPVSSPLTKHLSLICLFVCVDIFMQLVVPPNAFFLYFFSPNFFTAEQVEDWGLRMGEESGSTRELLSRGLRIERLTDDRQIGHG